jgi:hypothetical protein
MAIASLQQAVRFYLIAGQRDKAQPAYDLQKKLMAEKRPTGNAGDKEKELMQAEVGWRGSGEEDAPVGREQVSEEVPASQCRFNSPRHCPLPRH